MDYVIFILIGVLLAAIGLFLWMGLSKKHTLTENAVATIQTKWREIEKMMTSDDEHVWVRAIMEADKLMDYALKEKRVAGTTMGERLKSGKTLFRDVQPIWEAHKLRNQLVHEVHATINKQVADKAIAQFRRGLGELKAL
jgi:hypothetical protein